MFFGKFDSRFYWGILALIIALSIFEYASNTNSLLNLVLSLPGVIVAITFHEWAHAFVADRLGDDTARRSGRLTLNPLKHIDPIGFFMLVFAHFGWGKPVQIDERNFSKKKSVAASVALVSFAGPLMNFIITFVALLIQYAIYVFAYDFALSQIGVIVTLILQYIIIINLSLSIFNLLPLPPLDGSKIIMFFLPEKARDWFRTNATYFYMIFLILWITNIVELIIDPIINGAYNGLYFVVESIFRLFM